MLLFSSRMKRLGIQNQQQTVKLLRYWIWTGLLPPILWHKACGRQSVFKVHIVQRQKYENTKYSKAQIQSHVHGKWDSWRSPWVGRSGSSPGGRRWLSWPPLTPAPPEPVGLLPPTKTVPVPVHRKLATISQTNILAFGNDIHFHCDWATSAFQQPRANATSSDLPVFKISFVLLHKIKSTLSVTAKSRLQFFAGPYFFPSPDVICQVSIYPDRIYTDW